MPSPASRTATLARSSRSSTPTPSSTSRRYGACWTRSCSPPSCGAEDAAADVGEAELGVVGDGLLDVGDTDRHAGQPVQAHDVTPSSTKVWCSSPMPSIQLTSVSPGCRKRCGVRPTPTPAGVPVKMMSPGSSVSVLRQLGDQPRDRHDQVAGAAVLHGLAVDGAAEGEVVPVGQLVRRDQPRTDGREARERLAEAELRSRDRPAARRARRCPGRRRDRRRAPRRRPRRRSWRSRPMTATSSTSQSVWPPGGSTTSQSGPARLLTNLVNAGGSPVGASKPDSAACAE